MILQAAVQKNGKLFTLPQPYRHHHIISLLAELGEAGVGNPVKQEEQGFVAIWGTTETHDSYSNVTYEWVHIPYVGMSKFLSREIAYKIAIHYALIIGNNKSGKLATEDLW